MDGERYSGGGVGSILLHGVIEGVRGGGEEDWAEQIGRCEWIGLPHGAEYNAMAPTYSYLLCCSPGEV